MSARATNPSASSEANVWYRVKSADPSIPPYYWNRPTGKSQWEPPAGASVKVWTGKVTPPPGFAAATGAVDSRQPVATVHRHVEPVHHHHPDPIFLDSHHHHHIAPPATPHPVMVEPPVQVSVEWHGAVAHPVLHHHHHHHQDPHYAEQHLAIFSAADDAAYKASDVEYLRSAVAEARVRSQARDREVRELASYVTSSEAERRRKTVPVLDAFPERTGVRPGTSDFVGDGLFARHPAPCRDGRTQTWEVDFMEPRITVGDSGATVIKGDWRHVADGKPMTAMAPPSLIQALRKAGNAALESVSYREPTALAEAHQMGARPMGPVRVLPLIRLYTLIVTTFFVAVLYSSINFSPDRITSQNSSVAYGAWSSVASPPPAAPGSTVEALTSTSLAASAWPAIHEDGTVDIRPEAGVGFAPVYGSGNRHPCVV